MSALGAERARGIVSQTRTDSSVGDTLCVGAAELAHVSGVTGDAMAEQVPACLSLHNAGGSVCKQLAMRVTMPVSHCVPVGMHE